MVKTSRACLYASVFFQLLFAASTIRAEEPVYAPGGDVKAPKLIHYVEPEFSTSAKEAFVNGEVNISTVVTTEGVPVNLQVVKGLNSQEDQTALNAVRQWRFKPGEKAQHPVKVRITVVVAFQLL